MFFQNTTKIRGTSLVWTFMCEVLHREVMADTLGGEWRHNLTKNRADTAKPSGAVGHSTTNAYEGW